MRRQAPDERLALRRLEIDGDRALAAVAGVEIGGRQRRAVGALHEGRPPAARVVAVARPLDLDDVGAEIGERLADPGAGEDAGEFEDAEAGSGGWVIARCLAIEAPALPRRGA